MLCPWIKRNIPGSKRQGRVYLARQSFGLGFFWSSFFPGFKIIELVSVLIWYWLNDTKSASKPSIASLCKQQSSTDRPAHINYNFLGFCCEKNSLERPNLYYLVVKQLWFGGKRSVTVLTLDFHNRAGKGDLLALGSQPLEPCCSRGARGAGGHGRGGATGRDHRPRGDAHNDLALWLGHHRGVQSCRLVEQILWESKWTVFILQGYLLHLGISTINLAFC